ncbi:MAG: peptidyl-prolyl cis-trans isomerase [Thermoflexibacter sp.]|jgi:hypothetical protein|nr:peptidyl-prolyl cis-trans isomerase [Thermoflexibacter sp.]
MKKCVYQLFIHFQWLIFVLICPACSYFSTDKDEIGMKAVARVHNVYLYQKDLQGVLENTTNQQDSANIVQRYIDSWIKKQLLVYEAANNMAIDMSEIERRVQEYKSQLLIYAYQKQYIEKNLDTLVTPAQIEAYYKENQRNFELKQNIVKGYYLKIPTSAPKLNEMRLWLRSNSVDAQDEIKAYPYAEMKVISDTTWVDFEGIITNTPFWNNPNRNQLLNQNKVLEIADNDYVYLIKTIDYKVAEQISPLDFVKDHIIDIILNKRKIELQEKYEIEILNKAEKDKSVEVFR